MLKRLLGKLPLIVFPVLLGACGLNGPAHEEPIPSAAAVVDMGLHSFNPETLTIIAGQKVEWRNTSIVAHTVTADPKLAKMQDSVMLPLGAAPFNSGKIPAGKIYTRIFTMPGTYKYFCQYHEENGMIGTIVVKPSPVPVNREYEK